MTKRNPDYDFKWCPGCGDFAVVRAVEMALVDRVTRLNEPIENTVLVAGIGCSGNLVHLQEGPQPFGFHGIHGRSLPIAFGVKTARPDVNVLIAAGDGDFLSIGGEHIGPAAKRNIDVTCVIMDNGVYGLTKGQASPTTEFGAVTPTTPYGKLEDPIDPLHLYLTYGVSFVASAISTKPRVLAEYISEAMEYPGFSIVHVQSPCTTYNDTYEALKGDPAKGITPMAWEIAADHNPADIMAAMDLVRQPGIPIGLLYRAPESIPMHKRIANAKEGSTVPRRTVDQLLDALQV